MKQFIVRKLKENVPLSEIKKDLREKGYAIEEISKTVREAISGVDKKMSNTTIIQIAVLVVGVMIAVGVAFYFTNLQNKSPSISAEEELALIEKRTATGFFTPSTLQENPEEAECSKFIPSSSLNLQLQNYNTSYSIDGSIINSIWKSSSQPASIFSLTNLPEIFYVYQQDKLVGCGYSQATANEQLRYPEGWKTYKCGGTSFEVKEQNIGNFNIISMQYSGLVKFITLSSVSLSDMGCMNE